MKVTYLSHSGFAVELNQTVLIFDYWKGELPEFDREKTVFVFVSHFHADHFNPEILSWPKRFPKIHYFLSSDVPVEDHPVITKLAPNQSAVGTGFHVSTIGSTEPGVAFLVTVEGKSIYHAGDLHWWSWGKKQTMEESIEMSANFLAEMNKLEGKHFDLAFVVLDPRLDDRYGWGMECFLKNVDCDHVVPMHLWDWYTTIEHFKTDPPYMQYAGRVHSYSAPGEQWEV